jgi:hypothetical protein
MKDDDAEDRARDIEEQMRRRRGKPGATPIDSDDKSAARARREAERKAQEDAKRNGNDDDGALPRELSPSFQFHELLQPAPPPPMFNWDNIDIYNLPPMHIPPPPPGAAGAAAALILLLLVGELVGL